MKKTIIFFLLSSFVLTCAAQKYLDTICWVKVNDQLCMPSVGNNTQIDSLNTLFNKYKVHYYQQALPFAHNPELLKIYEIHCADKIENLITELNSKYKSKFTTFSRFENDTSHIEVYDPSDYMWTIDWLWHLKKTQCDLAWDITKGSSEIKIAILDYNFDITHPDLAYKIYPPYDPFDNTIFSCTSGSDSHGTSVASYAGAETDGGGQLASTGFKTMLIAYHDGSRQNVLQKALHACNVMGAKIIISCAGSSLGCYPDSTTGEALIVKEILDNGTAIIWPAGNGTTGAHCGDTISGFHAFYPFNPIYDNRIIIVSGTSKGDSLYYWANSLTFSDLCINFDNFNVNFSDP
ncbi:MAG: S8 family serine peptidase, partial [Bacteroidetes bacterium]|nr:S8 family serine peptidase [Bacteroidota bacterium]